MEAKLSKYMLHYNLFNLKAQICNLYYGYINVFFRNKFQIEIQTSTFPLRYKLQC